MSISTRLRKDADDIWGKIFKHPFVVELCNGTLPMKKFHNYMLQDYHYLISAIKNFGIISSKAESVAAMREVIEILYLEANSEFKAYEGFLGELGYSVEHATSIEPMAASISYASFLISTSLTKSYAEAITAVLPCFWSYAQIAAYHKNRLKRNRNALYKTWGSVYLSDSYLRLVEKLKKLVDNAGKRTPYRLLKDIFRTASRYEYLYWDACYLMDE